MVSVIKQADLATFPKTHDVRKYATSLAFFAGMNFQQIQESMGWKDHKVFLSHYKKDLCVLRQFCIALGSVIRPLPDASEPQLEEDI